MPLAAACLAAVLTLGACGGAPPAAADTVRADTTTYPSAAVTDGRYGVELVRDLDVPGAAPVGTPEADVLARYGPPDVQEVLDVVGNTNLYERRIEVLNVVDDWARRGETVRAREIGWELPNGWRRTVWLVDGGGAWTSAGGMEWASDRVDF